LEIVVDTLQTLLMNLLDLDLWPKGCTRETADYIIFMA